MNEDVKEVDQITFGVYSTEEIKRIAVCKVDSSKICSSDKTGSLGTVYDPRMGTLDNDKLCETCNLDIWRCPGHMAYISLNENIIHPLYYKEVINFLKSFCIKCYKLLLTRDQIYLNGFNKIKGPKRFVKILEKLEKIDICSHCSQPQPAIKYNVTDNSVSLVYKKKDNIKVSIGLSVDEILKIFDNIVDDDVTLIGFDPALIHPRNLILQVFPVIPPCCRPYVITDGNICDDDLTIQLIEIIKANNHLKVEEGTAVVCDTKRQKHIQSLKFRIATFYNNSCLAPDTPVLMWDGTSKRADEVVFGDELVGDDGDMRTVLSVCSGEDEMYEVWQEKGNPYVVNSNHYLTLKYDSEIIDIKITDYLKFSEDERQSLFKGVKIEDRKNISFIYSDIRVTPLGVGKYNGFTIDKNHRFVLGDFTITHNSSKAKHTTSGRAIKGLKERLTGKNGLMRTNIMGDRLPKWYLKDTASLLCRLHIQIAGTSC